MSSDQNKRPPVLVSACLAGLPARYDGTATPNEEVLELLRQGRAVPVCPEQLGGLPTPREPNEILDGRVVDCTGNDLTEQFERGARAVVELALCMGCREALLKARSPSCGVGEIYDGTFRGVRVAGNGILAQRLIDAGIDLRAEDTESNKTSR